MITDRADMILWQTETKDGVPEPPIAATQFHGILELVQSRDGKRNVINLNYESIPELIKLLKGAKEPN